MKKEWIKPEVSTLGMENTNEECTTFDDKGLIIHKCKYCGKNFHWDHVSEMNHEATCENRPGSLLPEDGEILVPIS